MIEYLPQEYFFAVILTALAVGALFLIIMYLCQYEDWKADTLAIYIDKLNTIGAPAMEEKPETGFSRIYIISLAVSLVISTVATVFVAPIVAGLVSVDPGMTAYVAITAAVATVLAIFLDGEIAHAIADKSFKSKYNRAQQAIIKSLEDVFRADSAAAAPQAVMTDEALAKLAELLKSKL